MKKQYQPFEDLIVWKEAMALCMEVYQEMRGCKDFALRDQMHKSAISIPSNIAEGYERETDKEFIRFLYVAKASCGELRTQLLIAISVAVLKREIGSPLIQRAKRLSGMIQNLITARKELIS